MRRSLDPFRRLLVPVVGWLGQPQRNAIDYLREENRVLREQLHGRYRVPSSWTNRRDLDAFDRRFEWSFRWVMPRPSEVKPR